MSLFSKDIIKRDINYRPDPHENMCFQLQRYFQKLCDLYSPVCQTDPNTFLKNRMSDFINELRHRIAPDWWEGPFLCVNFWIVRPISSGIGIHVEFMYTNGSEWHILDLHAPQFEVQDDLIEIYKN